MSQEKENNYCSEHSLCMARTDLNEKEIAELKVTVKVLESNMQDMKIQQIKDGEKIIALFNVMGDIKDFIQQINTKIEKIDKKQDTFKDFAFKLGVELMKMGILGGITYAVIKGTILK